MWKEARSVQDGANICQKAKKPHTSTNNVIYHRVPDSTGVINLLFFGLASHRHTYMPHYTGKPGITAPTASTLNSPEASVTSKQGLSDLTLEAGSSQRYSFI